MVPCAYLRVFEPLDVLPPADRSRWGEYVAGGAGVTARAAVLVESHAAVTRLVAPTRTLGAEDALVRRVGSRIYVCPLQVELRSALALVALEQTLPAEVLSTIVPHEQVRRAADVVRRSHRPPHIRESGWSVPLEWFLAFDPQERHFRDPPEGAGPRLTYLTVAGAARQRVGQVTGVVEGTVEDAEGVLALLGDLGSWLDSFDPDSLVELDYGGVAGLLPRELLAADRTCEDLWSAVESLTEGDGFGAAAFYGAVRSRWEALRSKQHAS